MSDVNTEEFQAAFTADCVEHKDYTISLDIDLSMALVVIANLQLALRHPGNVGLSRKHCRDFTDLLMERAGVTETIRRGLLAGDDPSCDVPRLP